MSLKKSTKTNVDLFNVMYQLFWLRNLAIIVQLTVIFTVHQILGILLPFEKMMVAITFLTLFNLFVFWRLKQQFPITEMEIAIQLGIDSILLSALLFLTGGSTNPFVSLFLVPIALSATFLSKKYVIGIAALCIGLYTFLMVNHHQMPSTHGRFGGDFNLHVFGMWVNFILSSIVVVLFITGLAHIARQRAIKLAASEQELLRNEFVVSLGTIAAGTAHEISTPLSNIGMMADELSRTPQDEILVKDFAKSIKQQQQICVEQLQRLRYTSEQAESHKSAEMPLDQYIQDLLNRWSAMRPEIKLNRQTDFSSNPLIQADLSLSQAITNLLNNAADASLANQSPQVSVQVGIENQNLMIIIDDYGSGLTEEQANMVGDVSFSTKESGLGLGLILSHASLARYNGTLTLNEKDKGLRSTICIPLTAITQHDN